MLPATHRNVFKMQVDKVRPEIVCGTYQSHGSITHGLMACNVHAFFAAFATAVWQKTLLAGHECSAIVAYFLSTQQFALHIGSNVTCHACHAAAWCSN